MRTATLALLLLLCAPLCAQVDLFKKREEFENKRAALAADDVEGRRALAKWCLSYKMKQSARLCFSEIVKIAPDDKAAREALGHVLEGATWFESDEARQLALGKTRRLSQWETLGEEQKRELKSVHEYWLNAEEIRKLESGEALLAHTRKNEVEVLTRDYRIVSALAKEKTFELASLIEQAARTWREAAKMPRDEKSKTLRVQILKDNAAFISMVKDDIESFDQELTKAQGFFDGQSCWLSYFDNWNTTERVLLHEGRHQFDSLVTGNVIHMPSWYFEGTAELYSMHTWDGKKLAMGGLVPEKNYSLFFCKKLLSANKVKGAQKMLEDAPMERIEPSYYQNAWAFIYYLRNSSYAEAFAKWEAELLEGKYATPAAQIEAFQKHVAPDLAKFDKEYKAQLKEWTKLCPKEWK
jgi:hypothetical protein